MNTKRKKKGEILTQLQHWKRGEEEGGASETVIPVARGHRFSGSEENGTNISWGEERVKERNS